MIDDDDDDDEVKMRVSGQAGHLQSEKQWKGKWKCYAVIKSEKWK